MEGFCEEIQISLSEKTRTESRKPDSSYVDITFPPGTSLTYIVFQNYYVTSVTIKQIFGNTMKTVLSNYRLTHWSHFENDSENWYIIPTARFNSKYAPNQLSQLRLSLNQPSPVWQSFKLRNISCYSVKELPTTVDHKSEFELFKEQLANNAPQQQNDNDLDTYETIDEIHNIEIVDKNNIFK